MQRVIQAGIVLALALSLASCSAPHNIREQFDPSTGLKTLLLVNVRTHNCPNGSASTYLGDVELVFTAQQETNEPIQYLLTPNLTGHDRVGINRGDTLDIRMDGVEGQLVAPVKEEAGHIRAHRDINVHETMPFQITREQLQTLSTTQVFQFRINGKNINVQRCTYAKDMKDLTEFLGTAATY